ncbi:lipocalin family protein [Algiphilus sp.]|uniref:lipocalin family protein n=1 Tax=Algiphilus sp. TaxID=1872431 RepID=UPI002A64BDCC|nr:lipocalin family protein [Pseudomonadota bacterium]
MHRLTVVIVLALGLVACASAPKDAPPLPRAENVDLERFMGDWYVIAHVPLPPEDEAFNAVERYALCADRRVETVFRYRDGGFEEKLKISRPTGYPGVEGDPAEWGMSFIWPFRAEFIIAWLDADYDSTIVARTRRDYAWLMHRAPEMPTEQKVEALARLEAMGYAPEDVRMVPQRWPEADGLAAPGPVSLPQCED